LGTFNTDRTFFSSRPPNPTTQPPSTERALEGPFSAPPLQATRATWCQLLYLGLSDKAFFGKRSTNLPIQPIHTRIEAAVLAGPSPLIRPEAVTLTRLLLLKERAKVAAFGNRRFDSLSAVDERGPWKASSPTGRHRKFPALMVGCIRGLG
jgi:hypothetical protein